MGTKKDIFDKLKSFLNNHRCSTESGEKPTHLGYGLDFHGKFIIKPSSMVEFINLYEQAYEKNIQPFATF